MIKTWQERCEEHPDHEGIVTEGMIRARMQDEIDELRAENERLKAERDELLKVCRMAMMLKHLGGMLPGSREIVDSIVNAASAAIAKVEGQS